MSAPPLHPTGQQRALTGLEGTAAGGAGFGIEAFKRQAPNAAGAFQLGAASKQGGGAAAAGLDAAALPASQFTELQPWSTAQLAQALAPGAAAQGSGNVLANFLTTQSVVAVGPAFGLAVTLARHVACAMPSW